MPAHKHVRPPRRTGRQQAMSPWNSHRHNSPPTIELQLPNSCPHPQIRWTSSVELQATPARRTGGQSEAKIHCWTRGYDSDEKPTEVAHLPTYFILSITPSTSPIPLLSLSLCCSLQFGWRPFGQIKWTPSARSSQRPSAHRPPTLSHCPLKTIPKLPLLFSFIPQNLGRYSLSHLLQDFQTQIGVRTPVQA